ncbi:MAG: thermonuclease family protein [Deltaproteobacteria bacterium]|nr:thermonuclease family protein [Deltaproteobacteria bacterium]
MRTLRRSACLVALLLYAPLTSAGDFSGRVVGVTDGDTIKALDAGREVKVRLHGIDSQEKRQAFGQKAKEYASSLAYGRDVTVRETDVDRYGRTVAWVILPDGRNLNKEMVRVGLAWWYRKYAARDRELERLESEARAARRGLWQDREPVPPWEWRKVRR